MPREIGKSRRAFSRTAPIAATARDAIGAEAKLTTASGRTLYNHMAIGVGFMSSRDKSVQFGLAGETRCTRPRSAPSGIRQTLTDVAADRVPRIDEPAR
jgi:hypothetical protein